MGKYYRSVLGRVAVWVVGVRMGTGVMVLCCLWEIPEGCKLQLLGQYPALYA